MYCTEGVVEVVECYLNDGTLSIRNGLFVSVFV